MKDSIYVLDNEKEDALFLKENIFKYSRRWPWFLLSIAVCTVIGFLYIRYAPVIYQTQAKIKIIDDSKEFDIAEDALSLLGAGSKINLDNEIAVIKSYRLLEQVVDSLHLDVEYYEVGNVKTRQVYNAPVIIKKLFPDDSLKKAKTFQITVAEEKIQVQDYNNKSIILQSDSITFHNVKFPYQIIKNYEFLNQNDRGKEFLVNIINKKEKVLELMELIEVRPLTDKSDVLLLSMKGESYFLSENILNELINIFNKDGILDRQLVSKRTLDFIDDRFKYLSEELDSIEIDKEDFKKSNNMSYIEADAGLTIEKRSVAESEVFQIETQIELSKLLKQNLTNQKDFSLLPADIGVENASINNLVFEYNQLILQRNRLIVSAGSNNPTVRLISSQLQATKQNILNTVNSYQKQLKASLQQLKRKEETIDANFSRVPEKEKMLRSIERQQLIKENLFLLLLQKREEAAINFAVTAPSVKIVDYGLTSITPIAPKKLMILGASLVAGIFLPLAFFFTKESFDTKIKSRKDLEKLTNNIPVLAEIPALVNPKNLFDFNERSVKAESFRILGTNINYLLANQQNNTLGNVIFVTSAIKGEGKTVIALNTAIAFTSLKKKVLLVGADLRNPQLHSYFNLDKNTKGLSDYLYKADIDWEDCINQKMGRHDYLDICFSGPIPPNPSQLIASDNLSKFLEFSKTKYDYVIVDTAPTVLVADTLIMSSHADVTLFITRSNFTDKKLIEFSKELQINNKLKNMAYVLNDVQFKKGNGYNYGYEYGYGIEN